jgi:hypothetical protein
VTPRSEHALFLHECFFDFVFRFACDGSQNRQRVCIKFCVKLGKSATETLEMLHEAFEEHCLSRTAVFEWHSPFKAGRVSDEEDKQKKFENCSTKTVAEQSMSSQSPLGSVMEFARRS